MIKLDAQLLDHLIVDCGKISHVILGIYQLLLIKRSLDQSVKDSALASLTL